MSRIFDALTKLQEEREIIEKDLTRAHGAEKRDALEEVVSLSPLILIETLRDIKKGARSIYKMALLLTEKGENREDRERYLQAMAKAYDQMVATADMLTSYINVTSPILKKDTLHHILDEILESAEVKLAARNIELKKSLAQELPETIVHDEQVRFILHSTIQYVILLTPPGGSIEIATQYVDHQKMEGIPNIDPMKSRYSEILISSLVPKNPFDQSQGAEGLLEIYEQGTAHFILHLIKEMSRRNQGMFDFQLERTKTQMLIFLRFPVERRRLTFYRSANL